MFKRPGDAKEFTDLSYLMLIIVFFWCDPSFTIRVVFLLGMLIRNYLLSNVLKAHAMLFIKRYVCVVVGKYLT